MSRDFDGTNDKLEGTANATLRPALPVTVAAWIYADTIAAKGIFTNNKASTQHKGIWFGIADVSGHLESAFGDNTGTASTDRRSKNSTSTVSSGSWHHVACRIRGATDMDILINAVDAGGSYSGTGGALAYATTQGPQIGTLGGTNFFDGRIAEVGFWTVSLSDAEITALAKGVSPRMIRPDKLIWYVPTWGVASPEVDDSGTSVSPTVTEAVVFNHSPTGPIVVAA